jgi:hypothetical protein
MYSNVREAFSTPTIGIRPTGLWQSDISVWEVTGGLIREHESSAPQSLKARPLQPPRKAMARHAFTRVTAPHRQDNRLGLSNRTDRWTSVSATDEDTVTGRDDPSHGVPGFGILSERIVVDALLNFELTDGLGRVGGFVDISRHFRYFFRTSLSPANLHGRWAPRLHYIRGYSRNGELPNGIKKRRSVENLLLVDGKATDLTL